MAAASLKQSKIKILLSINAACILIAGIVIAGAIGLTGGIEFTVVAQDSDIVNGKLEETQMLDAEGESNILTEEQKKYISSLSVNSAISTSPVADGELWSQDSIVMYLTANYDICVGGDLTGLGSMYWQTSNSAVISGFYSGARTWLGFDSNTCRYPLVVGTGTTTITAGTYDGLRHDSIELTVIPIPEEEWKYEILKLVNLERVKNGLGKLTWGESCEEAAQVRAKEQVELYSHTRPNGSAWSTACVEPNDNLEYFEGENLMAGNSAVDPESTVAAWMNSEAHKANILNPNFTKLAVGFYFDPESQYKTYWSQYFSNF